MRFGFVAAAGFAALVGGCVTASKSGSPIIVGFGQIPGWSVDSLAQSLPALRSGCRRLATLPADQDLGGDGIAAAYAGKAGLWAAPCEAATTLVPGDEAGMRAYYERWFTPYRIEAPGLFTGYYEPEVGGASLEGGAYHTPVLARPDDLSRLVPYWSRADIEAGKMGAAARPLMWLADPVDLFFLQIQGAGRVRLADGGLVRLGYDGKNGRPYTPVGRVLIERGALVPGAVTMQSIRAWLAAHPEAAKAVMDRNEDYVFFRVLTDTDTTLGPPGALGVRLVAGRTAAVDRHAVPLGTPIFVDTTDPIDGKPWRRLLLAQDVGSDISGAARTDIFLGAGSAAEQRAGMMHQGGTEYLLLPRPASR